MSYQPTATHCWTAPMAILPAPLYILWSAVRLVMSRSHFNTLLKLNPRITQRAIGPKRTIIISTIMLNCPLRSRWLPYCGTLTSEQYRQERCRPGDSQCRLESGRPSSTSITVTTETTTIPSGSALAIFDATNAGVIRCLNIKMPANATDAQLESLRLRVSYDNSPDFAIDVPIAHFFGAGFGRIPYKSLPIGTDSPDGFYCYLPMPFRHAVHVEIYNSSTTSAAIESAKVEYEVCSVACDMGYCHAVYSKETTVSGQQFHILLSIQGQGHYIGNLLYLEHAGDQRSMLEADDIIVVNPNSANQIVLNGTGLEDAYNGGYYYNHVLYERNSTGRHPRPCIWNRPIQRTSIY